MLRLVLKNCHLICAIIIITLINGCTTTKPISGELSAVVDNSSTEQANKQYKQIVNEVINEAATDFLIKAPTFLPPSSTIFDSFRDEFSTVAMLDNGFLRVLANSQLYSFAPKSDYYFMSRISKVQGNRFFWKIKLINKKYNKTLWSYQKNITKIYK